MQQYEIRNVSRRDARTYAAAVLKQAYGCGVQQIRYVGGGLFDYVFDAEMDAPPYTVILKACRTAGLCAREAGELALLGAPFEMMQGIRREVCAKAQATYPAILSLCGDALGYAPDSESAEIAKLYESKLVPLINGLLPYGNIWNELPSALVQLERALA